MKKIYFIITREGFWEGFVTTSEQLAREYITNNPQHKLLETDLREIDFEIEKATLVSSRGSVNWEIDKNGFDRTEYLCFVPVYDKQHPDWRQLIRKTDMLEVTNLRLVETKCFEEGFFDSVAKFVKPVTN